MNSEEIYPALCQSLFRIHFINLQSFCSQCRTHSQRVMHHKMVTAIFNTLLHSNPGTILRFEILQADQSHQKYKPLHRMRSLNKYFAITFEKNLKLGLLFELSLNLFKQKSYLEFIFKLANVKRVGSLFKINKLESPCDVK